MAIDESAGVKYRRDAVVTSASMSLGLAILLKKPQGSHLDSVHTNSLKAMESRGWIERRKVPGSTYDHRWHLTESGREIAEASPSVREWIEGWKKYD